MKSRSPDGKNGTSTLFFVDSVTSYDDRIQSIGRATARLLSALGDEFAILGPAEKDSGHEVRRFGEELLFRSLRDGIPPAICRTGPNGSSLLTRMRLTL